MENQLDKETSEKLNTLIGWFQLVLEQIHIKNNFDKEMMRRDMRIEILEEIEEDDNLKKELLDGTLKELLVEIKQDETI
jgi:hypothetical protein